MLSLTLSHAVSFAMLQTCTVPPTCSFIFSLSFSLQYIKNDKKTNKYDGWPEMLEMEGCVPRKMD